MLAVGTPGTKRFSPGVLRIYRVRGLAGRPGACFRIVTRCNTGSCERRVLLTTFGSRGDVQPVLALAVAVRALGADARVCAPPDQEFLELFAAADVPLLTAFTTVRDWL